MCYAFKYLMKTQKSSHHTQPTKLHRTKEPSHLYSILISLIVACSACFAWLEFNAHWLREFGGSFLLVENTPTLLLLHMGLLGPKMGENSTPADPPELWQTRLKQHKFFTFASHHKAYTHIMVHMGQAIRDNIRILGCQMGQQGHIFLQRDRLKRQNLIIIFEKQDGKHSISGDIW